MQLVICLAIISYLVHVVRACSCIRKPHVQTYVCESEYVIRAKVLSKEEIFSDLNEDDFSDFFNIIARHPDELKYTIQVLDEYKTSDAYDAAEGNILFTEGSGSFCGVDLQVGSTYLITGTVYDGHLRTDLCHLVKKWKPDANLVDNNHVLTRKQVRYFRQGYYLNNCDCPVNDCTNMGCFMGKIPGPSPYCLLLEKPSCYKHFSFCKRTKNNGCKWKHNKVVKECLAYSLT